MLYLCTAFKKESVCFENYFKVLEPFVRVRVRTRRYKKDLERRLNNEKGIFESVYNPQHSGW